MAKRLKQDEYCCFCSSKFAKQEDDIFYIYNDNEERLGLHWTCFVKKFTSLVSFDFSFEKKKMPDDITNFIKEMAENFNSQGKFTFLRRLSEFCEYYFGWPYLVNKFFYSSCQKITDLKKEVLNLDPLKLNDFLLNFGDNLIRKGNGCLNSFYELEKNSKNYFDESIAWKLLAPKLKEIGVRVSNESQNFLSKDDVKEIIKEQSKKEFFKKNPREKEKLNDVSVKFTGKKIFY